MKKAANKLRWEQIADIWDAGIGEDGDIRHKLVINPVIFEFLGDLTGKSVLDAGCGNGYIARKMAKTALHVVAVDFTERLIVHAKKRSKGVRNISYRVENIEELSLPDSVFDVVLCTMVFMDLARLDKAVMHLSRVLKKGGTLVVSTQHPCFENAHKDYPLRNGKGQEVGRVITDYFTSGLVVDAYEGFPHYHWKLSEYLNAFSKNFLLLENVSEPNNKEILKDKMTEVVRNHTPMFIIFKLKKIS